MQDQENAIPTIRKQTPWNKGKLTGAKPPLRPKHVWSIRTKLQIEGRVRDLAMFNLAIDSKLRGCNVVAVKVDDVAAGGIHRGSRNRTPEENLPSTAVIAACAACCCSAESAAKGIITHRFQPAPEAGNLEARASGGKFHSSSQLRAARAEACSDAAIIGCPFPPHPASAS
jgi:hypothetical protein